MDDTQDKVRRNLVVVSAAIVFGWFLDLKLTAVTKLFTETDITNINSGKLWLVIFVVLIYLYFRYWFDSHTESQIDSLRNDLQGIRTKYLNKYLLRIINRINRTGEFSPVFNATLADTVNLKKKELTEDYNQKISFRLKIPSPWSPDTLVDPVSTSRDWSGIVGITEEYYKENYARNPIVSTGVLHKFTIPLSGRTWISVHSLTHLALYSKSSIDFIVPIVLASFALLITIYRLLIAFHLMP